MERIKPAIFVEFNSSVISGGNRRTYQILRLGKTENIAYIVVTNLHSCQNATKMFPDYMKVLSTYKVYLGNFERKISAILGLKQFTLYLHIFRSALFVSKIAKAENADLIVGGEELESILTCYLAAKFSKKPWTAVFQPFNSLLQPSVSIGGFNVVNVLNFVNKKFAKKLSFFSKIGCAIDLFIQLKVAEKSLMLSVGKSLEEEIALLNPKIGFLTIRPGNGIDVERFSPGPSSLNRKIDALFFARLLPEKGLLDLPPVWKYVVQKKPDALLAVAGIMERKSYVKKFLDLVKEFNLDKNVLFLGQLDDDALLSYLRAAKVTLYPSLLDTFPLVTLESLACGTPVIAYDIPAISRNLGDCSAVLLSPAKNQRDLAENALLLIENEELRHSLSRDAVEYSRVYTWSNVVKAEKAAYLEVIQRSK
jgi:glycosyltransferase involved in cell wall biosynthesis